VPYEVRAKAGESVFSVVVGTAKEALAKIDELTSLSGIGLGKSWTWER
jgi:hypothetical protein